MTREQFLKKLSGLLALVTAPRCAHDESSASELDTNRPAGAGMPSGRDSSGDLGDSSTAFGGTSNPGDGPQGSGGTSGAQNSGGVASTESTRDAAIEPGHDDAGLGGNTGAAGGPGAGGTAGTNGEAGSGGAGEGGSAGTVQCDILAVSIDASHLHSLTIPPEDVAIGQTKVYVMSGLHTHMVTVTEVNFAGLAANGSVTVESGITDEHSHAVVLTCV